MIQLPTKPWNEGDTFTNDTTGVEYTFDGVKWLASGGEELDLDAYVSKTGDTMTGTLTAPRLETKIESGPATMLVEGYKGNTDVAARLTMSNRWNANAYGALTFHGLNGNAWFAFNKDLDMSSKGLHSVTRIRLTGDKAIQDGTSNRILLNGKVTIPKAGDSNTEGLTIKGKTEGGNNDDLLSVFHNSTGLDAVNYKGKQDAPTNLATVGYVDDSIAGIEVPETDLSDYVKRSDSWDMSLGTSLGVNVLKPLDGGTPYVYYEPRDYNSTHPCGIVNRGLMQAYVNDAVSAIPESKKSRITTQVRAMFSTQATQGKASFINRNGGLEARPDSAVGIEYTISRDTSGYASYKDWWGDDYEPLDSGYIQVIDPFTGAVSWAAGIGEVTVTGDTIRWMASGSIYTNYPDWNANRDYFLNLNGCLREI